MQENENTPELATPTAETTDIKCRTCGSHIAANLPWFGECKKCYDRTDDEYCDTCGSELTHPCGCEEDN
jgi:hypothetical protein